MTVQIQTRQRLVFDFGNKHGRLNFWTWPFILDELIRDEKYSNSREYHNIMRSTQNLMDAARYLSPQLKLLNFFVIPLEELVLIWWRHRPWLIVYDSSTVIEPEKDGLEWAKSTEIFGNSQNWKSKRASYEENYRGAIKMSHPYDS